MCLGRLLELLLVDVRRAAALLLLLHEVMSHHMMVYIYLDGIFGSQLSTLKPDVCTDQNWLHSRLALHHNAEFLLDHC